MSSYILTAGEELAPTVRGISQRSDGLECVPLWGEKLRNGYSFGM
ncbi:MAG: hypothetical protein ACI87O_000303 [Planctomycetota bacterium]|jgi:hypothetical protein